MRREYHRLFTACFWGAFTGLTIDSNVAKYALSDVSAVGKTILPHKKFYGQNVFLFLKKTKSPTSGANEG